ncbi:hypothetical protein QFC19_007103 [Naganishia cerealis]|uniref:Uncharacterized protein n=1 Tax=Naganishia cerealis TaxID=610337 RepID=A0ACC2VCK6_9TREE|nr:hypothetical protein QFC19_007103 [Naganishia cerealis]
MSVDARFKVAVEKIGALPKDGPIKPSQEDQLTFYGLFKQANVGDVNTARPGESNYYRCLNLLVLTTTMVTGLMDFAGKYKWDAWKKNEGKSQEQAKKEYVDAFLAILDKNPGPESDAIKADIDGMLSDVARKACKRLVS